MSQRFLSGEHSRVSASQPVSANLQTVCKPLMKVQQITRAPSRLLAAVTRGAGMGGLKLDTARPVLENESAVWNRRAAMTTPYLVGAAAADITPSLDKPVYIAGFAPNRTALSVLHPLKAQALYVRDPGRGVVCFVSLDLIGFPHPLVEKLRNRVSHLVPKESLVVCSTHTHSGPDTLGLWGKALLGIPYKTGIDQDYIGLVIERTGDVIEQAVRNAAESALAAVTFDIPHGWVRNDRKGGGSYRRGVALVATRGDRLAAIMLNFAAHPEALWEKNRQLSPDYPGPYRNWMEKLGVEEPLFFSGPIGAMLTPDVAESANTAERRRYIEQFGRMLALLTLEKAAQAEPLQGPVVVTGRKLSMPNLNKGFEFAKKLGLFDRPIENSMLTTEMSAGRIGGFRFVTVPGEPSPELGHALHNALGGDHGMLLCLGQDELGYILPAAFFSNSEYKYEHTMSVGPHAGPTVLETARELVERLNHE